MGPEGDGHSSSPKEQGGMRVFSGFGVCEGDGLDAFSRDQGRMSG